MDPLQETVGLCATCQFRRTVTTTRSTFYLCERSFSDPRFAKYPAIPVLRCVGYQTREDTEPGVD